MKKISLYAFYILALSVVAGAQELPVELVYKGAEIIEVVPGAPISAVFLLKNPTNEVIDVDIEVNLPDLWSLITIDGSFEVAAEEMHIILSSFVAPRSTRAGPYYATFIARKRSNADIYAEHTVAFWVQERIDVEIIETETFGYLLAGQDISDDFHVHNKSNTAVSLEIEAKSSEQYELTVDGFAGDYMTLQIGESRLITVNGKSRADTRRLLRHRTRITAFVLDPDGVRNPDIPPIRGESGSDILPRVTIAGDRYNRLPLTWSLLQSNKFGTSYNGNAELRISGNGALDEAGEHDIDFLLAKRIDIPPYSFTHPSDLYRLIYSNSQFTVLLGDGSYGLSPLTEESRRGQGVSGDVKIGNFEITTYYHQSYWADPVLHFVGGKAGYRLRDPLYPDGRRYSVDVNLLGTIQNSILFSVNQLFLPTRELKLKLEVGGGGDADGNIDFAVTGGGSGNHGWISYALESAYAGPRYPSQYTDLFFLTTNLDFAFFNGIWDLDFLFNTRTQNLSKSTDLPDAPVSWELGAKTRIQIPVAQTSLRTGWSITSRRDSLDNLFDSISNKIQVEIVQPLTPFRLNVLADILITRDRIYAESTIDQNYSLGFSYSPTDTQQYNFALAFDGLDRPQDDDINGFTWETGASIDLGDFDIDFGISNRSEFTTEKSSLNLNLDLSYQFGEYGKLSARGEYGLKIQPDSAVHTGKATIQYTGSFLLPVSRKSGIGAVVGSVENVLNGKPLPNIVVRLDENAAVTDRRGNFVFPAVSPGTHYLDIDSSLARIDLVPLVSTPLEVEVASQKDTTVDIPMGILANIDGSIMSYSFTEESEKFRSSVQTGSSDYLDGEAEKHDPVVRYNPHEPVPGIVVEIEKDDEVQRRVSDVNGKFVFEDLAPGIWRINIFSSMLPEYTYPVRETINVNLKSGIDESVRIDILPIKREIQIIGGGEL